jgi:hypothetical protein
VSPSSCYRRKTREGCRPQGERLEDLCVIDDLDEAVKHCSPVGRTILGESVELVRASIRVALAKHRWTLIAHDEYRSWASQRIQEVDAASFVLDPLLDCEFLQPPTVRLRVSRILQSDGRMELTCLSHVPTAGYRDVMIVDDAAASGRTISGVASMLIARDVRTSSVTVCASSDESRRFVRRRYPWIDWRSMLPGNWRTLHARDILPLLPYSGRPVATPDCGGEVQRRRLCPVTIDGSSWRVLFVDTKFRQAILNLNDKILARFEVEVGRPPQVADLPLLGAEIGVVSSLRDAIPINTALADLRPFGV